LGILADDLTGALDTGVQFREKGFATFVPLKFSRPFPDASALVFNSGSRHLSGKLAYERVRRICKKLSGRILYKKIDSTLRGNVGREIEAMLDGWGYKKAILVPSYPAQGRTVENGILRLNGIPLHRTSFGKEFKDPLTSSSIPNQLEKEIGEGISRIGRKGLSQVPTSLARRILQAEEKIVLIDAKTSSDLRRIARAWILVKDEVLACGSAGLAKEMPVRSSPFTKKRLKFKNAGKPFLIVSGSRNQRTLDQLGRVIGLLCFPLVEPDLKRFTHAKDSRQEIDRLSHCLFQLLEKYPGAILSTSFQRLLPNRRDSISTNLGKVAANVLSHQSLSGLILTGGDVAWKACHFLESSAMRIEGEILPGIPLSSLTDGPFKGLRIITKSGGFGDRGTLVKLACYLGGEK
jgi:uncharacterized protein YgbK (DUF1537 family)